MKHRCLSYWNCGLNPGVLLLHDGWTDFEEARVFPSTTKTKGVEPTTHECSSPRNRTRDAIDSRRDTRQLANVTSAWRPVCQCKPAKNQHCLSYPIISTCSRQAHLPKYDPSFCGSQGQNSISNQGQAVYTFRKRDQGFLISPLPGVDMNYSLVGLGRKDVGGANCQCVGRS